MSVKREIDQSLTALTLEHWETGYRHHSYDEELMKYEYMKKGDMRALAEGKRTFEGPTTGSLSDDPVTNYKYLFVASITLACRFCIEGGMPHEQAYNLSDLYIRKMDRRKTVQEIFELHDAMIRDFTTRMQAILRGDVYSRPIHLAMDYIDRNLQQPLTVEKLAQAIGRSPAYLSTLFKKETGVTISHYIQNKRIEAAKLLLQYTEFSCIEIAEYLCFSSDSHLSRVFKARTGQSPTTYRKNNFRKHWENIK